MFIRRGYVDPSTLHFPWRVDLDFNGKPFEKSPLVEGRAAATQEYQDVCTPAKRLLDNGKIGSYHISMKPIPWIG